MWEENSVISTNQIIEGYLNCIVGTPLQYGIKSTDINLYQLGFGESIASEHWNNQTIDINKYTIHFDSALYLYWENGEVDKFYSDSRAEKFNLIISKLLGKVVKRIALSVENDLWIDLGDCHIVIVTRNDDEESWRFFLPRTNQPHLIASSVALELDDSEFKESDSDNA